MKNLALLFILTGSFCLAQTSEKDEVQKVVNSLFTAMKNSDTILLKNAFTENAILQSVKKDGTLINDDVSGFAKIVGNNKKGNLDERIIFSSVLVDGNLASVWTPYEFYFSGKFSHCGVNSFQLVKQNGEWKIHYLIDTRRKEKCSQTEN